MNHRKDIIVKIIIINIIFSIWEFILGVYYLPVKYNNITIIKLWLSIICYSQKS